MASLEAIYTHGSKDRPPIEVLLWNITTDPLLNIPERMLENLIVGSLKEMHLSELF